MSRPQFTRPVERPKDASAREGYGGDGLDNTASDQTVGAGNSPVFTVISSGDSDGQQMLVSSVEATSNYDPSVSLRFTINDGSGDVYQVAGMLDSWPVQFDAEPLVPSGGSATIRVNNPTASAVDVRIAHTWRLP